MFFPWQRIAMADSRTPRCESMNVSAALYRAGSSVSRGSPTTRIMSPPGASRRVELDVRIHDLRMLALQPLAQPREDPLCLPSRDLVDPRLSRDSDAEGFDDFLGRSLAHDETACAPRELVRDVDKDDADHCAG